MSGYFDPWICEDCELELHGDTIYMVVNALWLNVKESFDGHLCCLCLEARLGRTLVAPDFTDWPINDNIVERLCWMRVVGREALLEMAGKRRARLDRRAQLRRERTAARRRAREAGAERESV